ncbi:hypothetical protein QWY90_07805 [Flavobacterium paronense]|uniref:Lipocalin-like domain-containing protein n=1 Tax=Flavobacterium paronense TaxID=1392775 RepID=A0ABV5GGT6_9FLAO|nr:hypothetical protein [Flavobacterium paronense]MDN3677216.1 hypothetical protein [Flavobacterium paronense]
MKKVILFIFTILALSCSSEDTPVDGIVGKWMLYKAEYENTVYNYEINGQCGSQALVMVGGNNKFVTETYYSNADCTGYTSRTEWEWVKENDGTYGIYPMGQTVPERTLILTNNEIKVTEPGFITVTKYYKRIL